MTKTAAPPRLAPSVDDAIAAIRAYVRFKGWKIYTLAKVANLPRSSLILFNDPLWSPKSDTLRILYSIIPPDFDPASVPPDFTPPGGPKRERPPADDEPYRWLVKNPLV